MFPRKKTASFLKFICKYLLSYRHNLKMKEKSTSVAKQFLLRKRTFENSGKTTSLVLCERVSTNEM